MGRAFNYASIADDSRAQLQFGFDAGKRLFDSLTSNGYAYLSSEPEAPAGLHVRGWELFESQPPVELGTTTFGVDGDRFAENTKGKLETVDLFRVNSGEAAFAKGEEIKVIIAHGGHESRGWPGAVIVYARVQLRDSSWLTRIFGIASSGVQGEIDQLVSATVGYGLAAAWCLSVKAADPTIAT